MDGARACRWRLRRPRKWLSLWGRPPRVTGNHQHQGDLAIRQLERIQKEAQLDQFLAMMQFWSIPHEKTMHSIDLFGKYVIPHFRDRKPAIEGEQRPNP